MMKCPKCEGTGHIYDPINSHYGFVGCGLCSGSGNVDGRLAFIKDWIKEHFKIKTPKADGKGGKA
jgi:hypothetical protein